MIFFTFYPPRYNYAWLKKLSLVMRLTTLIILLGFLHVSAASYGQRVNLNAKNISADELFKELKKQTGYSFIYKSDILNDIPNMNVEISNATINEAMDKLLKNKPLAYIIIDKSIVIRRKEEPAPATKPAPRVYKGKVLDEFKRPLPGVTIKIKGSTAGQTTTDKNGEFAIVVPDQNSVLQISSIGYEKQELALNNLESPITVIMSVSTSNLDQVQVTAYGTTTKRLSAGDITTITAADIAKNPVNNVLEALQGKVPGLFIQQVTGQPGGAFTIKLRGSSNFTTSDAQPLIVVDGVRYPGSTLPLSTNTSYGTQDFLQGGSGLNYINPNDIESINVLKDVEATALYGSAGAYGVILITTKRAKPSDPAFNVNVYTGVSTLGETTPLLNTQQYLMLRAEAIKNDGGTIGTGDLDLNGTWPANRDIDWRKQMMGNYAATTNADLSYSGGSKNTSYLISGSLRDNGNIQRHKGSDDDGSIRFSLNTKTDDDKFSFNLTGTFLASTDNMVPYDFSTGALTPPNAPSAYNPDGSINWASIGTNVNSSQVASNINRLYKNTTNNLLANATLVYRPTKQLTFRAILGYNDLTGTELIGYPTTTFNPTNTNAAQQSVGIFHHYDTKAISIAPYGEYNTTLGKKGDLSVKLGGEADNTTASFDDITGQGFPSDALLSDPSAGSLVTTSYNLTPYRSIGIFGIIKYVWDQKYILDINTRRDGSIRFGPGNRIGNFGSVAGAWIFSEESFIKDNLPFLSYGKLRASTGVVGGDAIPDYQYLSTYSVVGGTYDNKTGLAPNSLPDPDLNWEKDKDSEVGLELGFLKDRLYLEGDYYHNVASNQLVTQPLSTVTGFSGYSLNSDAVIRNTGWELTLSSTNIKSSNFTWSTRFNITIPHSKLLKVPSQKNQNTNFILDKPVTGILLYKYNGVDPATGYYSFTNAKGVTADYTGGLSQADKTQFVDLAPKYYGGLQNTFTYKQLSVDFSISYTNRVGQNFLGQTAFPFGLFGLNGSTAWLNRWQKPGDVTNMPRVSANFINIFRQQIFQSSTGAYTDATYARLQNVSIRYHFTGEFLRKLALKEATFYLQGQNLLTVSKFGGLDPENLSAGVIPPMRVFTAGVNLTL